MHGGDYLSSRTEGQKPSIQFHKQSVRVGGDSQGIRSTFGESAEAKEFETIGSVNA